MLSVKAKTCATLAGTGSVGLVDGTFEHAQFSEPGGICLRPQGDQLIVADTNNHSIRVLHLEKKEVSKVSVLHNTATLPSLTSTANVMCTQ